MRLPLCVRVIQEGFMVVRVCVCECVSNHLSASPEVRLDLPLVMEKDLVTLVVPREDKVYIDLLLLI